MIAIVLLALGFMPIAAAEPWLICGDTANNYTANSRYHANLELLATALTYNASTSDFLFAAGSVGAGTDMVYGLALCRGDSNATACRTCVAAAFWDARQRCGYMKDAIIFYDTCLLRFSNGDFVDFVDYEFMGPPGLGVINTMNATDVTKAEPMLPGWDPGNTASVARITKIVMLLLQETSSEALQREIIMFSSNPSSGNKITFYATGRMDVSSGFPQLYSMAQCTPDLDFKECQACFQYIGVTAKENFAGKQGGRVLCPRCNLRYDTTLFYRGEPMKLITAPSAVVPPVKPAAPPMPAVVPQAPLAVPSVKQKAHYSSDAVYNTLFISNFSILSIRAIYCSSCYCFPALIDTTERMSKNLVIALVVPLLASCFFLIITFRFVRRHKKGKGSQDKAKMILKEDEELVWGLDGRSQEFTIYDFSQVLEATSNFSEENKLGQGGFGPVYKGRFPDGLEIAVKRLASESGQGFIEFKNEVLLIAKLQHTNLVRLLGCCSQGREKILIYEYLPNKSLDFFIFDETRRALLVWNRRQAIIEGIAQGILYLHKHSRLRVIHRDLKASNILLDSEMNPKISDFGLAKIFSTNNIEGNTERIVGTYGYMAPEYVSEGLFSIKSDIFSFGVLILEIVSGQKTSRFHRCGDSINLLGHAWQLWKNGLWLKLVDTSLVAEGHTLEMMRCINIALLCVQENAADRPTMSHVVTMLSSQSMTLPEPKHPAYFNIRVVHEDEPTDVAEPSSLNNVTMSALHGR